MRFLLLALLLFASTSQAFSRNGETGILIVFPESKVAFGSSSHQETLVLCQSEWSLVHSLVDQGVPTHIWIRGYGAFEVALDADGAMRLEQDEMEEAPWPIERKECPALPVELTPEP